MGFWMGKMGFWMGKMGILDGKNADGGDFQRFFWLIFWW